ncbi:hypothetical protein CYMTET_18848 [Cymbomonas tetramitiformis]|uniref:Uncharacterized protein n=1 Tax=Cymbomonas tetramitiformis TaxID=36881 RepID=A0AAE0G7A1_9CHLO|nr:hypothetical protein CYMTET_18848 [Cymbomonas tetramitiformis]
MDGQALKNKLNDFALLQFPGYRTQQKVIDKDMMNMLVHYIGTGGNGAAFAKMACSLELESALDLQLLYATAVDCHNRAIGPLAPKIIPAKLVKPDNGLHEWGVTASDTYYLEQFKVRHTLGADYKRRYIQSQGGEVLKMDYTFEEKKHIRVESFQVCTCIFTIQNEFIQPVLQLLCMSKSLVDLKPILKRHYATYKELGLPEPKIIFVDDIEASEEILKECYPSILEENGGYGVKECPTHAMRRVLQTLTHSHVYVHRFMSELSLVMYELDDTDMERVKEHLKKEDLQARTPRNAMTDEEINRLPLFQFWHHHPSVKRRLRQADDMCDLFDKMVNKWKQSITWCNGKPLFTEGADGTMVMLARFRALIIGGYLSDPDFPMHINIELDPTILPRYITKRGNSQLEGYHAQLHKILRHAPSHGVVLAEAKLLEFNYRFSVECAYRNRRARNHGSMNFEKMRQVNTLYEAHPAAVVPFPDLPVDPAIDVTMGLIRFDGEDATYKTFCEWVSNRAEHSCWEEKEAK